MKQKSIKVDARLYNAAGKRLSAIGFDNLNRVRVAIGVRFPP